MGTLFLHLLLGDWTAILSGHLSYAKVKPFPGQGLHLHSLVNTLSIVQIKKNVKQERCFQSVFFKKAFLCIRQKKKKQAGLEPLPYARKNVHIRSCLHGNVTDRGYLENVNKLCLAPGLWPLQFSKNPLLVTTNQICSSCTQFYHHSFYNSVLLSGRPKL